MRNLLKIVFTLVFVIVARDHVLAQNKPFQCVLIGEVIDRPQSRELLLIKEGEDLRISAVSIPIVDGRFTYTLTASDVVSYQLSFEEEVRRGSWRSVTFFAEEDTLRLKLFPEDHYNENSVVGGLVNGEMARHEREAESRFGLNAIQLRTKELEKTGKELTAEAKILQKQISEADNEAIRDSLTAIAMQLERDNKDYTPEARALNDLARTQFLALLEWRTVQVLAQRSLITYRDMLVLLRMAETRYSNPLPISVAELLVSFEKDYKPKYPDHPYTRDVETYLTKLNMIKEGGRYIDFAAPDFGGNMVQLSEQIKGKYALINLWASWCGPCRRKGIDLIPVYQAYRDRGFEIVGVARERNKEAGINAATMDGYPWLNLLEINDSTGIWKSYGVGNGGGGTFLVDPEGVILTVSPTSAEVQAILAQRLP